MTGWLAPPWRGAAEIDLDRWVTFMRTELAWREGDLAAVVDYCLEVLAAFDSYQAIWWEPLPGAHPGQARHGGPRAGR